MISPDQIIKNSFEKYSSFPKCIEDLENSGWHLLQQPEFIDEASVDTYFPNDRIFSIKGIFDKEIIKYTHLVRESDSISIKNFIFKQFMYKIGEAINIINIDSQEESEDLSD